MHYKLQEFNKDYILTGATKLDTVKPLSDIPLDTDIDGTLIVDLNDNTYKTDLIPLYTVKVNNEQFQNVVNNEFTEFTIPALDRTPLFEAEIDALKSDRNRLASLYKSTVVTNTEQAKVIQDFSSQKFSDRLYRTFALSSDANPSKLMSKNRRYILYMQNDGNLVTYEAKNGTFDINAEGELGAVKWSSGTGGAGNGPFVVGFQADTNLVIRNNNGTPIWDSKTDNKATVNSYLVLQNNGALQITDTSDPTDVKVFWQQP
jgi:hypothetical protein